MSGWRHVEEWRDRTGRIVQCAAPVGMLRVCGCTTPTPDQASPCAVCGEPRREHELKVEYEPTRCTCGHQIERNP